MRIAAMLLCIIFAGCAGLPAVPTEVMIPIASPCLESMPERPKLFTDAELLTMPDAEFIIALAADRLELAKYMALADALLAACVK